MKKENIELMFVISVFLIAYAVISNSASISGFAISSLDHDEKSAETDQGIEYKNVFIELQPKSAVEIKDLEQGNTVVIIHENNRYAFQVMRIVQNYDSGKEYSTVMIIPGSKRIFIEESQGSYIDFNNDGKQDAILKLKSIAYGKATFEIKMV